MQTVQEMSADEKQQLIQGPGDEWTYEMRRQCQEILPGLYLGPLQVSKSLETLQSYGVTHILCIRDAQEAFSVRPRFPDHFQYMTLDVRDNEDQNLIKLFPQAKEFIDQARLAGGRALVHCNGGISLSPSFVVMYVMQEVGLSWEDALHMVQNRRYCISPNGGFLTQLKEYESIYKAHIAVQGFPQQQQRAVSRRKREEDDDADELREQELQERKRAYTENANGDDSDDNAMQT
ncbi:unnamed protein product [Somion occarium]|uniref:Protein-tyrosine-phosphatase n=1 Tax=Somion occarium TaxID=3059160 RepID=A0ABP1E290_9APHY